MLRQWWARLFLRKNKTVFKPVVLVTGCASGIGLALAHLLAQHQGYRVVLTAREKSLHKLRAIFYESDRLWLRPLDVTSASSREALYQEINEVWGGVNVLINNAGISYRAVVEHMTEEDEQKQMATNYFGSMAMIRLALPSMREKGRGKIINVSSVSGMLAMPTMSSYSASKYALEGACEALWYETKPFGIDVVLVQPGFVHSNSFQNVYHTAQSQPEVAAKSVYADYYYNMVPFITRMMNWTPTTPEKIAKSIYKIVRKENPPLWVPVTYDARVFYYIRRILPRRILLPFLFACLPKARTWGQAYSRKRK